LRLIAKRAARTAWASGTALILAACCTSCGTSSSGSSVPHFSLGQINNSFSAMSALRPLAARGRGTIAVIMPYDASARHFVEFDAPYITKSFQKAGLKASQYKVTNPPSSDQFNTAREAIARGASVLIVDARYSGAGAQIESYAKAHGVAVIDYDWLTVGGTRKYYVGFDSLKIGVLLGRGLVNCVSDWRVKNPRIIVMSGAANDYNVPLYAQGYDTVLAGELASGWREVSSPAGTWDGNIAESEFQQQYTMHKTINAALIPNDEDGAPIIAYLQSKGIKARTFPITGLDATLTGLQNILAGYQCGTVYKPIWLEAQAAAALAMYVRAGVMPPASLLNSSITDSQTTTSVASVLLTPEWVTTQNMNSTVIADGFVQASALCAGKYALACSAAGISG
jgi:D-xylose transport system substrate-binding protein